MRPVVGFTGFAAPRSLSQPVSAATLRFGRELRTAQEVLSLLHTTFKSPIAYDAAHEAAEISHVMDLGQSGKKVTVIDAVAVADLPDVQTALAQEKALGDVLQFISKDRGRTLPVQKGVGETYLQGKLTVVKSLSLLNGDWEILIGQRRHGQTMPSVAIFNHAVSSMPVYNSPWQAKIVDAASRTFPTQAAQLKQAMIENIAKLSGL